MKQKERTFCEISNSTYIDMPMISCVNWQLAMYSFLTQRKCSINPLQKYVFEKFRLSTFIVYWQLELTCKYSKLYSAGSHWWRPQTEKISFKTQTRIPTKNPKEKDSSTCTEFLPKVLLSEYKLSENPSSSSNTESASKPCAILCNALCRNNMQE